jgi:hypothetical protein
MYFKYAVLSRAEKGGSREAPTPDLGQVMPAAGRRIACSLECLRFTNYHSIICSYCWRLSTGSHARAPRPRALHREPLPLIVWPCIASLHLLSHASTSRRKPLRLIPNSTPYPELLRRVMRL